jgi:hypothetical protein
MGSQNERVLRETGGSLLPIIDVPELHVSNRGQCVKTVKSNKARIGQCIREEIALEIDKGSAS